MDINLLSRMVWELIMKHDQVGLPGIGTFVAEMVPASFSDKGYTINPPYRRLNFYTANLEDEVLTSLYASANGLDEETAKNTMKQFLSELKVVLLDRRTIALPGLGRLRATKENNFFFVPDENLDIFPDGYGLSPISLKTHVETREEIAISVSNLANIMENGKTDDPSHDEEPISFEIIPDPAEGKEAEAGPKLEPEPKRFRWWMLLVIILGIAFVVLCTFMILAAVAPDFIDSLLYTPEELEIINY